MSHRSAWVSHRDGAFALAEEPQQRRLTEWTDQGARRRAEWEGKRARVAQRLAELAASVPAIMTPSEVTAAVAEALQAARAVHHEELDLAPPTMTASITSEMSPSTQMSAGAYSTSTSARAPSASKELVLAREVPITRSTECPGSDTGSTGASTACMVHEGDDDLISVAPSKRNSATAALDPTSTPTMPSHLVSGIEPLMPTRCLMEHTGDDTTVEAPAFPTSAWSSTLEWLGDTAPAATTVLECADGEEVIASQLSDINLKHSPVSRSFFVSERGTPATNDSIQVTALFPSSEVAFPTIIIRPIAVPTVQFVLSDVRPLPWPSFLDCYRVGDEILLMPCSLFTCFPRGGCQKHPWPPLQMISLIGHYCSVLISMEGPSSFLQCVHMQLCCSPDGAKLNGILFLFKEGAQVDRNSLRYFIQGSSETMQWEIAWTLSDLSCRCEHWTSGQLHFLVPGSQAASSMYALLIYLKAQDEIEMRLELSLQTVIYPSNFCSIVLHYMGTCSSLQNTDCPWFLATGIQVGTPWFLGTDDFWFQLSTEGYIEIHYGLLLYTWSLAVMIYFTAMLIQLSRGIIRFAWEIAWLLVETSYVCSYFEGSEHDTSISRPPNIVLQDWLSCFLVHIIQCGFYLLQWMIAWSLVWKCLKVSRAQFKELLLLPVGISAGIRTLQLPWHPGACSSATQRQDKPEDLNDACSNSPNAPSQVPWDPGGSSQDRLGGKPNFKKGGLSAILLAIDASTQGLGWNLGRHCWALACSERSCYKYCRKWPRTGGWDGSGGFGLDLRVLL